MNKRLSTNEHVFLIDQNNEKPPTPISMMLDISSQAMTFVDDALASNKPVLMILPSKARPSKIFSVYKPQIQKDFATLMRQVEKEIYG
jgi:hypothetical protein